MQAAEDEAAISAAASRGSRSRRPPKSIPRKQISSLIGAAIDDQQDLDRDRPEAFGDVLLMRVRTISAE